MNKHGLTFQVLESALQRAETRLSSLQNHKKPDNLPAGDNTVLEEQLDEGDRPQDKIQAWELWKRIMGQRFIDGKDDQFDYSTVDHDETSI